LQSTITDCALLGEVPALAYAIEGLDVQNRHPTKSLYFFNPEHDVARMGWELVQLFGTQVKSIHPYATAAVFKEPRLLNVLDLVNGIFGSGNVVVIIRDPLDIAASFIQIGEREIADGVRNSKYARRDLAFICKKIEHSLLNVIQCASKAFHLVRYEDLVDDWSGTVSQLCHGLRVNFDISRTIRWLPDERLHKATWTAPLVGGAVAASSVGSHLQVFSNLELEFCRNELGELRLDLGYAN